MPAFFLDGEPLVFNGPSPGSFEELISMLETVLGERARIVADVRVDGAGVGETTPDASRWNAAQRVEVDSVTIMEALARAAADGARRAEELAAEADRIACEVLRKSWNETAPACVALATRSGELMRDLAPLVEHLPALQPAGAGLTSGLHTLISAIEARDAGGVCLALDRAVLPAMTVLRSGLQSVKEGA